MVRSTNDKLEHTFRMAVSAKHDEIEGVIQKTYSYK